MGQLYILPFVNEKQIPIFDKTNRPDINRLEEAINTKKIETWLNEKNIVPNFSIFKKIEKNITNQKLGLNIDNMNYDNFIKYVLPLIIDEIHKVNPNKKEFNVVIVSHGIFMYEHITKTHNLKLADHIGNTDIWKEVILDTNQGFKHKDFKECSEKDLKNNTCSKTIEQFSKATQYNTSDEKFDYCLDKMEQLGTLSNTSKLLLPYAYSSHVNTKETLVNGSSKANDLEERNDQMSNTLEKLNTIAANLSKKVEDLSKQNMDKASEILKLTGKTISDSISRTRDTYDNLVGNKSIPQHVEQVGGTHINYEKKYAKYKKKYLQIKYNH